MAGSYGHERHQQTSKRLFDLSWRSVVQKSQRPVLVTVTLAERKFSATQTGKRSILLKCLTSFLGVLYVRKDYAKESMQTLYQVHTVHQRLMIIQKARKISVRHQALVCDDVSLG